MRCLGITPHSKDNALKLNQFEKKKTLFITSFSNFWHKNFSVYYRPLNSIEKKQGSRRVIQIDKAGKEVSVDVEVAEKLTKKKYSFDQVSECKGFFKNIFKHFLIFFLGFSKCFRFF